MQSHTCKVVVFRGYRRYRGVTMTAVTQLEACIKYLLTGWIHGSEFHRHKTHALLFTYLFYWLPG